MAFNWKDKINGENGDDILAEDINSIAHEAIRLNENKAEKDLKNVDADVLKEIIHDIGISGVFSEDENGNITAGNNVSSCMAYYIKSIDLENKKIYLTDTKTLPVISTADNRDTSFETPAYESGRLFNIINQNQYLMRASIVSVQNNVVTYDGDLGFTEIYPDDDYDGHTFCVPEQPEIGVVQLSRYSFGVGDGNILAGRWAASVGRENVGMDYSFSAGKRNRAVYTAAALGEENDALGQGSFTACVKNKTTPKAYGGSAIGIKTVSNAHGQSVRGMYNAIDEKGEFLDIVGNGSSDGNRSNAYTLDKKGNARYMGKVYQENDTELATKAYAEKLGAKLSIEPDILFARKDDKLYSTARDSCNVAEMKDSDGIVYDHVTPLNHASKLLYDKFTESGKPFEIPLATGRIWLKLLMRSNQAVTPTAELYQVSTESGATLSSISSVATKAMSGNGEWEEVIIPFEGYIANAYKAKQIHIRLAGYDKNGSDFYDASGKLIGSPYFDIAGWAIFTDEEIFNLYEFYNEMVGIGSASVADLLMRVRELEKGGTSGFKKIGFTSDCDYVATASDGHTAFNNAVADANDGDTILVMPGVYKGSKVLNIKKNLNFVALAKNVTVEFGVDAGIDGSFNEETGEFVGVVTYRPQFSGITFTKSVSDSAIYGWGEIYTSSLLFCDCSFTKDCNVYCNARFYRCVLDGVNVYADGYPGYGDDAKCFYDCKLNRCTFDENSVVFERCDISLSTESINVFGFDAKDCVITTLQNGLIINGSVEATGGSVQLTNCVVYGDITNKTGYGSFVNTYKRELGTVMS